MLPEDELRSATACSPRTDPTPAGRTFFDSQGRPSYMTGACVDISSLKKSEQLLEQSSRDLARHIRELNCLYTLSKLVEQQEDLADLFRQVVQILPSAFEPSGDAVACILREGEVFQSGDPDGMPCRFEEVIAVDGQVFARLKIYVATKTSPSEMDLYEGELQTLAREIVRKLGRAIERRLALAALRESEDRWRAMTSALAEGVVLHDRDGRIVTWNPSAERLLGLSHQELSERAESETDWQAIREDGSAFPADEHPAMITLRTGQPCNGVVMGLQKADGTLSWISINSRPLIHAGSSTPHAVVASFDDITQRKLAGEALQREMQAKELERSRLRAVLDVLPVGVYISNAAGELQEVNAAAHAIWGFAPLSKDQAAYDIDYKAWWPKSGERVQAHEWGMARALNTGEVVIAEEMEIEALDGTQRTILNYAIPFKTSDGQIAGGVAVNVDISERKRTQERTALLAAVAEISPDAIASADLQGRVTSWNFGAEHMYGYKAEEILGRPISMVMPADRQEEMGRILESIKQNKRVPYYDTLRQRKDGVCIDVSIAISPILDATGRVIGAASMARNITERKRMEEQLQHNAFHDRLTGVPNRSLFMDRLSHVIARAERFGETYAVFVMDVDNFKLINDSYGHLLGDKLLCSFVDRIQHMLRPVDTLARFGGDEFTILLEEADDLASVEEVATRILDALRPPFAIDGQELVLSSSIGITLGDATYRSADQALRDADVALYEAKRRGKNQFVVFDTRMRGEAVSRLYLESELRRALLATELSVEYQPIVDLHHDRVVGCEALVRWNHSVMGLVEPSRFINVAEETGLITPLGRFVLERSCQVLAEWRADSGIPDDFYISVNISPKEFYASDLVPFVQGVLLKNRLRGANIRLEITENVVIQHAREATAILLQLRKMGVQVCMDDFGTGYSSLSYLHQLPFDVIKVDRSFIQRLAETKQSREIVRSVLGLAQALDMQSIAEGAETAEQLAQVKDLGFRWAQGFVLHRPMDKHAMRQMLLETV